jgi:hypothetical protein
MHTVRVISRRGAFTLVEVTIAASLLLATCLAISAVLGTVTKAEDAAGARDGLELILTSECRRLAALPYFHGDSGEQWPVGALSPDSLVAEVFPWARPELDTVDRWFVDDLGDADAGTFVTTVDVGGVRLRRRAVFLADERDATGHLGVADLVGWDCVSGARPPATSLAVTVDVSARGRSVSRTMVFSALRPSFEPSPQPAAG